DHRFRSAFKQSFQVSLGYLTLPFGALQGGEHLVNGTCETRNLVAALYLYPLRTAFSHPDATDSLGQSNQAREHQLVQKNAAEKSEGQTDKQRRPHEVQE